MSSPSFYRPDIDGLRALAVLAVVAFHAFPATLGSGFIGVDIFFVLSGYLIGGIILRDLQADTFSFWNFYSRRIRRIFPALITVMLAALVFGWLVLFPGEYQALGKHIFGGASFSSNFFLWNEAGYFDTDAKSKPLLHLWSLGIEEQFYILFPLLLWFCARRHWRIATVLMLCIICSMLDNFALVHAGRQTADFYSPFSRFWELLAGASLVAVQGKASYQRLFLHFDHICGGDKQGQRISLVLALGGVLLIAIALVLCRESAPYPGWRAILPVLGTVLLLAAGQQNPLNLHILGNPVAAFLGRISYPLYLWHWVLLSFACIINGNLDRETRLLRLGLVALSLVLAILTYFCVERPIRFGKGWPQGKVFALMGLMLLVGGSGLLIYGQGGATQRAWVQASAAQLQDIKAPGFKPAAQYKERESTMAIIGDSHADHLYYGLTSYIKPQEGLYISSASAAAPYIDIASLSRSRFIGIDRSQNYLVINKAYNKIIQDDKISTVILAHRPSCSYRDIIDIRNKSLEDRDIIMENGMRRSFDVLLQAQKNIIVLLDNPQLPFYPQTMIHRPFSTETGEKYPKSSRSDQESWNWYKRILEKVLKDYPGIKVLDLSEAFAMHNSVPARKTAGFYTSIQNTSPKPVHSWWHP